MGLSVLLAVVWHGLTEDRPFHAGRNEESRHLHTQALYTGTQHSRDLNSWPPAGTRLCVVSALCLRRGSSSAPSKEAGFWGMISIHRVLSRMLQMLVDEQASLVNPSAGSKHPPGI